MQKPRILKSVALVSGLATFGCCSPDSKAQNGHSGESRSIDDSRVQSISTLSQGWSHDDANWFYGIAQGSRLIPYDWFLCLERADDETPLADASNIRRLGYISRSPAPGNPDGLPVGFTKDKGTDQPWLGMTCAACHTAQINYGGKGYLIDGAPTNGDLEALLRQIAGSLEALTTDSSSPKLIRFANKVLKRTPTESEVAQLRLQVKEVLKLRKGYNDRNLSKEPSKRFGYARYDAFGAILNEVTVRFLACEQNKRVSDAPVSYPFIWDTPQHDFVQWNGMAANDALRLGNLARNAGEVLGVFGEITIPDPPATLPGYGSSIEINNLRKIERKLEKLQSPLWPDDFPRIDSDKSKRGRELFVTYCIRCHDDINRSDPFRKITARTSNVGTDPQMARNFVERMALTMRLQNTAVNFKPLGRGFETEAPAGEILIHSTVGAILGVWREAPRDALANLRFGTSRMLLRAFMDEPLDQRFKYKGRPLNGIWATAPYLHNGSVPNLYELLLPAADRSKEFWVGRREFDPQKVGFVSGPGEGLFRFDTSVPGNLNTGHEYGTGVPIDKGGDGKPPLKDDQPWELVEYLKSL